MQPHAIITPLKAIRMLLDGSGVLVRAERWEEMTMPARTSRGRADHGGCQKTITRQREEIERLRAALANTTRELRAWHDERPDPPGPLHDYCVTCGYLKDADALLGT